MRRPLDVLRPAWPNVVVLCLLLLVAQSFAEPPRPGPATPSAGTASVPSGPVTAQPGPLALPAATSGSPTVGPPIEKASGSRDAVSGCNPTEASRLLAAYFGLGALERGRPTQDAIHQALARQDLSVQFLVATVPEPRLGFDGTVESLTRALEATGFLLDRYLLPWNPPVDKRSADMGCSQEQPGIALFHRAIATDGRGPSRRGLLILYLVGESPIAGIHKTAFTSAIDDLLRVRALVPDGRCESCGEIRMVGPAFSGAVTSLELLLAHYPMLSFRLLSGRATNGAIRDRIQKFSDGNRTVSFQATVIPDEALQTEFFCFLTETLGADEHDVALITESSTGYGQAIIAAQAAQGQGLPPGHDRVFPARPSAKSSHCQRPHRPRLTLPVPLHIARLHSTDVSRPPSPSSRNDSSPLPELMPSPLSRPLPTLLDDSPRTDVIPTLSPRTVSSAERSLAHILSTIYAEKIRYVGILATDVQDKLFLARQIRAYCPDVVLFTFESDILFTHPEARPYLKGMLVVSPYPLFTRNQQWSYPFRGLRQRIQFASDADQGVYNATVALLGYPEQLVEYSQAAPGVDKPLSRPAIWVSAVGNDTLFPLAFIKDYEAGGYVYENPSIHRGDFEYQYSPYQQGTVSILMLIIGLLGLWLSAGYFWHYYYPDAAPLLLSPLKIFRKSSIARSLLDDQLAARESARQPIFMLCLFVPSWLGYFVLTTTHFMQLRDGNLDEFLDEKRLSLWLRLWYHSGHIGVYQNLSWKVLCIALFGVIAQLAFTAAVLDAALLYLFPGGRGSLHKRFAKLWQEASALSRRLFVAAVALCALGLTTLGFFVFVAFVNYLQVDFNHLLFLRRSAQPAFGLSPMMPLILLGLGVQLFGYCELQRIRMLEKLATVYLDLLEELEDDRGLCSKIGEIAAHLGSPSLWHILAGVLLSLFQAATVLSDLVTLEMAPMHLLFRFLIALQVTTIGFVFYRFLRLWSVFRDFLTQLSHHPLSQSLERLPHKFIRSLGALFLEDLPELTRRQAAQEHFRLLVNHMDQLDLDRDLKPLAATMDIDQIKSLLDNLRELQPHLERETTQQSAATPGDVADAQVVRASRILTQILKRFWRARPLPGTLVAGKTGEPVLAVRPSPDQNTAEVYHRVLPDSLHLWLRLAEDFLAIQVVTYINRLFPHLRNGLLNVTVGFVLLLLALIVYPFQPQRYMVLLSTVLLVLTVPTTMNVLAQMNRDEVLSRIAKSQPGKLTWDRAFISQVVIYGVLPLLSLIATQFPEVRGAAFSWIETALKTLK